MRTVLAALTCISCALAADVANLSGTWKLNLKKSHYEKEGAPLYVDLKIEHNEPSLKYSGSVLRHQESPPDTFEFEGAIDDKTYPVKENNNTGRTIKFVRKTPKSIESWSSDNTMKEHAIMTVSSDGKTLTRRVDVRQSDGKLRRWTEVYDKQG